MQSSNRTLDKYTWKLADYLDVLKCLRGHSYAYFTSSKSHIIKLIDWFTRTQFDSNSLEKVKHYKSNVTINLNAKYTDIMQYKRMWRPFSCECENASKKIILQVERR